MGIFRNVISWLWANPQPTVKETRVEWDEKLLDSDKIDETSRIGFIPPRNQYIIKLGGNYYVFGSKSEMPEDLRKGVENVENSESAPCTYTVVKKGMRETFSDIKDLPPNIRKMFSESGDSTRD